MRATASTSTRSTASSIRSTAASPPPMSSSRDGRVDPAFGWIAKDYLGIDQGPILAMICNYRNELVWDDMRKCVPLRRGLASRRVHRRLARPGRLMPGAGALRRRPRAPQGAPTGICWGSAALRGRLARRLRPPQTTREGPLDFWAMGREAEVVAELLAGISCAPSDRSQVRVQQLPWTAAHEKLLTAYAGDALPDLCQLGNTWLPEFSALGALEPLDARLAARRHPARRLLRRHPRHQRHADAERRPPASACRGTSTRACSSIAATCCAPPAMRSRRRPGPNGARRCSDIRRLGGGRTYGALLPLNEPRPAVRAGAAARTAAATTATRRGAFSQPAVPARARLLRGPVPRRPGAADDGQRRSPTSGTSSRAACSPSTSAGPGTSASSGVACPRERQGDWATAPLPGPDGPGVSTAGGSSLVIFKRSRRKDAAWKLIEFLSEPETMQRFHALTGDLPPRRSAWRAPALADDPPSQAFARSSSACAPRPRSPSGSASSRRCSSPPSASSHGPAGLDEAACRSSTPGSTRCSRSAAGCARDAAARQR